MAQRNSSERADMLAERIRSRRDRLAGYERMARKPRTFVGKDWDPRTGKVVYPTRMIGYPASINRRTGQPHANARENARRLACHHTGN